MDSADELDGRRLRRERNREQVLRALSELFSEGSYTPTSRQIAERSGLSVRSLVRYFDDLDDLVRSSIERDERQAAGLGEVGCVPDDPTDVKVKAVVEARVALFEAIAPGARAGRACAHRQPLVAARMQRNRRRLRQQLARLFAPELARTVRPGVLPALDVLMSFESWDLMRGVQRLSRRATAEAMVAGALALLGATGPVPAEG